LTRTLIALVPAGMLLVGSLVRFARRKTVGPLLQLVGAGCLVLVVLTHLLESLQWIISMGWGVERSVGHYIDWWSAALALTSFPLGYLLDALGERRLEPKEAQPG